jgi:4a-hydroxytetrahydrobiopterin dehydratase
MKKLSQSQADARLEHLEGWEGDEAGSLIQKEFRFDDFVAAMSFTNAIADEAEEMEHHPDICISYNSVVCMLTSHEKGGLTEADFKLAKAIDEIEVNAHEA